MDYKELKDFDEVIDEVIEWLARKWTTSMIKRQLRELFPGISTRTCVFLIGKAKKKIRELYGIDVAEYRSNQISFYESIIRNKSKIKDKLTAAERLDKLFGLEHVSIENPNDTARKVQDALKEMDETILGSEEENGGSENGRERQVDPRNITEKKQENTSSSKVSEEPITCDEENKIPKDIKKELSSFKIENEEE